MPYPQMSTDRKSKANSSNSASEVRVETSIALLCKPSIEGNRLWGEVIALSKPSWRDRLDYNQLQHLRHDAAERLVSEN